MRFTSTLRLCNHIIHVTGGLVCLTAIRRRILRTYEPYLLDSVGKIALMDVAAHTNVGGEQSGTCSTESVRSGSGCTMTPNGLQGLAVQQSMPEPTRIQPGNFPQFLWERWQPDPTDVAADAEAVVILTTAVVSFGSLYIAHCCWTEHEKKPNECC